MLIPKRQRPLACNRCHRRKIKCYGGAPCPSCRKVGITCTYPPRNQFITVPEAYLRHLESLNQSTIAQAPPSDSTCYRESYLQDCTAETFVSTLRKVEAAQDFNVVEPAATPASSQNHEAAPKRRYEYVPLVFDESGIQFNIRFPPFGYAKQLVHQFELFVGCDYHWYRHTTFHERLNDTFRNPLSTLVRDRTWLCKLFVVFALGASYMIDDSPPHGSNELNDPYTQVSGNNIPSYPVQDSYRPESLGADFFEQALQLFKLPTEEYNVENVEVLNLMSFYSYTLNRRRTAYMYAGLAQRIAGGLMLHKTEDQSLTPAELEHQKRVWWTMFIMDSLTATAMGLRSSLVLSDTSPSWPENAQFAVTEQAEFNDGSLLTAHIRLYEIRMRVLSTLDQSREQDNLATVATVIQPRLIELAQWKAMLSPSYNLNSVDFDSSLLAIHEIRPAASTHIRHHQTIILLLRPVFLRVMALAFSEFVDDETVKIVVQMSSQCLEAARSNLNIFTWLSAQGKLAKYGFWESLHLFSSLKVVLLGRLVNLVSSEALKADSIDHTLFTEGQSLLKSMAWSGNRAAKSHVGMLEEVSELVDRISKSAAECRAILDWTNAFDASNVASLDWLFDGELHSDVRLSGSQ